jgi:predicted RNA-binding Zn-ribbon protein involved in translation (DUF1610 family)
MSGVEREREKRANELYWGSELSVNQIADEMDVSKGMLYELIHPEPAGLVCPACAQELVYANRTARDRSLLACTHCGWEGDEEEAELGVGDASVVLPEGAGEGDAAPTPPVEDDPGRRRFVLGGALLGAAVGLAFVLWSRRR